MGAEVRDRRLLEHDLRHAISRRELSLVYQPQKDIKTDEVIGFEALLRWSHPERGDDLARALFIPIAEESGAILQIGEWVLRTACRRGGHVEPADLTDRRQRVGGAAAQRQFRPLVHEILFQTGLPPRRLELEITETALIRDLNRALVHAASAQGAGRADRHGRLRHRLFVALQPARLSLRQDQDRRLLHQIGRCQRAGRHDRARRARPRPRPELAGAGRRRRDRRRACSSCPRSSATRCRAICSAGRPTSSSSAISPMVRSKRLSRRAPRPRRRDCASSARSRQASSEIAQAYRSRKSIRATL